MTDVLKSKDTRNLIDQYKGKEIEAISQMLRSKSFPLHVAIENLQHDFNIGSIVRTANAFNVRSVHIVGKKHWNRRGAMATEKYLDLFHHKTPEEFVMWVRENHITLYGVDNVESAVELGTVDFPKENIALVFGQEGPGLSVQMQEYCEQVVFIKQYGSTRSINVGAAAAIVIHEWVRRYFL